MLPEVIVLNLSKVIVTRESTLRLSHQVDYFGNEPAPPVRISFADLYRVLSQGPAGEYTLVGA